MASSTSAEMITITIRTNEGEHIVDVKPEDAVGDVVRSVLKFPVHFMTQTFLGGEAMGDDCLNSFVENEIEDGATLSVEVVDFDSFEGVLDEIGGSTPNLTKLDMTATNHNLKESPSAQNVTFDMCTPLSSNYNETVLRRTSRHHPDNQISM